MPLIGISITEGGNLNFKLRLLGNKQFLANYGGSTRVWKFNFWGNQNVPSSLVTAEKSAFLKNVGWLRGAKYGGTFMTGLGVGIYALQWHQATDPVQKFEYSTNTIMSTMGFFGLTGAAISGIYFLTKPLQKKWNENVLQPYLEMNKGQETIDLSPLMPFK